MPCFTAAVWQRGSSSRIQSAPWLHNELCRFLCVSCTVNAQSYLWHPLPLPFGVSFFCVHMVGSCFLPLSPVSKHTLTVCLCFHVWVERIPSYVTSFIRQFVNQFNLIKSITIFKNFFLLFNVWTWIPHPSPSQLCWEITDIHHCVSVRRTAWCFDWHVSWGDDHDRFSKHPSSRIDTRRRKAKRKRNSPCDENLGFTFLTTFLCTSQLCHLEPSCFTWHPRDLSTL